MKRRKRLNKEVKEKKCFVRLFLKTQNTRHKRKKTKQ